jgi:hypothetical protein
MDNVNAGGNDGGRAEELILRTVAAHAESLCKVGGMHEIARRLRCCMASAAGPSRWACDHSALTPRPGAWARTGPQVP